MDDLLLPFERIRIADVQRVGGKNASLGELTSALTTKGINVPPGFATTASAYRLFLEHNAIAGPLAALLDDFEAGRKTLSDTGAAARQLFLAGALPTALAAEIAHGYEALAERIGRPDACVAVRSSATAEDLPEASFAGQQESFLNVRGEEALLDACRRCFASLYTDRAISYRQANHIDQLKIALSVGIQQMVRSDLGSAGVLFTLDTETGFPRVVTISAAWGLAETVVQGSIEPDSYAVFKPLMNAATLVPIVERRRGAKQMKLVCTDDKAKPTELLVTNSDEREAFVLNDAEIMQLARWASLIEDHYGRPMDVEWARDGLSGAFFIVQARPETGQARRPVNLLRTFRLQQRGLPLLSGAAIGEAIANGEAYLVHDSADMAGFPDGAILVAASTNPDWVPVMRRASGIVTDHGGATSHAAIVARELGVPAVVGTGSATASLTHGQPITLSCAEGDRGFVYRDKLAFQVEEVDVGDLPKTRTAVMVNSADPDKAFHWWKLPAKGVGLARMEFIINSRIKIHPMAVAHPELVKDGASRRRIAELALGFADPKSFFVETLATGIAKLAAPFHPYPAIVRLSDFKTNEYAHLLGGSGFEPAEENPMLGFRGASRYYDPRYSDGFALECQAIKRARETLGFSNIIVMVPFCRTVEEADRVLATMAGNGLKRGEAGLQVYMMCEIPSNVVLAEQFAQRFDGFSIGSNDLTQLILGVDRDSAELGRLFNERDPAVKAMIVDAIDAAHRARIKIGICGQAPSDYPDFAAFLVEHGIDSISLNPDSFVATAKSIAEAERPSLKDVAV